jgi:hypothetical protein
LRQLWSEGLISLRPATPNSFFSGSFEKKEMIFFFSKEPEKQLIGWKKPKGLFIQSLKTPVVIKQFYERASLILTKPV